MGQASPFVCRTKDSKTGAWETETLDEHVALIKRQVDRSLEDPELRVLARTIVEANGTGVSVVRAWGNSYPMPLCDAPHVTEHQLDALHLTRIWNFVVRNYSYIEDPPSFDLFSTARLVLDARASADLLERELGKERSEQARLEMQQHIVRLRSCKTLGAGDCDDATIVFASLAKAAGFRTARARVVSTSSDYWEHVYPMIGVPRTQAQRLVAMDATVRGATLGWEYPRSKTLTDFVL